MYLHLIEGIGESQQERPDLPVALRTACRGLPALYSAETTSAAGHQGQNYANSESFVAVGESL